MTSSYRIDGLANGPDIIDLIGGQLEIVGRAAAPNADAVIMRGAVLPGGSVPLHSHADYECFHVVSGQLDVFVEGHGWNNVDAGHSAIIANGERHAVRNVTHAPVELAIVVNNRLAQFFQEAGTAGIAGQAPPLPTPDKIERVLAAAQRYGYWLATPEEHAAMTG